MVFVNLLEHESRQNHVVLSLVRAHRPAIEGAVVLFVAGVLAGWWTWSLHRTSDAVNATLAAALSEKQQAEAVVSAIRPIEARAEQAQRRLNALAEVERRPGIPAALLAQLATATPTEVWLVEVAHDGSVVTLRGVTPTFSHISEFVASLEGIAHLKPPVEILDTQAANDPATGAVVKFSLKAAVNP